MVLTNESESVLKKKKSLKSNWWLDLPCRANWAKNQTKQNQTNTNQTKTFTLNAKFSLISYPIFIKFSMAICITLAYINKVNYLSVTAKLIVC